ncbi:MAG: hydratase, partial [Spirochaetes bacterium]|nr:hydratase [Spirochaetota bacterium]
ANISIEYATKRYRSNLINWGMLPFIIDEKSFSQIGIDDFIIVRDIRKNLIEEKKEIAAVLFNKNKRAEIKLFLPELTKDERDIIIAGSLINYYRN